MLKKFAVFASTLAVAGSVFAQGWVAPAVIGGAIGYGMARNQQPPQVTYYPAPTPFMPYQQSGYDYVIDGNVLQAKQSLCYQSYPYDPMRRAYCLQDAEQHSRVYYRR